MTDNRPTIEWQPHDETAAPERGLRDDPGRIVLLVAAGVLLVGGLMPWAEGLDPGGRPIAYTPQQGLAEGYIMIVLALILAVLARGRVLVESTSRTVQLLPLFIAAVAATMWLGADRMSLLLIDDWTSGGGEGVQTIWRLVTAGAIVAIVAGMIMLELTRPASIRAQTRGLFAEWRPSKFGLTQALVAGGLGLVGAAVGAALTMAALGPNGAIFAVFISLFGMAAGISTGLGIARWIRGGAEHASDRPSTASSRATTREKVSVSRVIRRRS